LEEPIDIKLTKSTIEPNLNQIQKIDISSSDDGNSEKNNV